MAETFYHPTERMMKRGVGLIPWGWTGPIPQSVTTIHFFSFQPTVKANCCAMVRWILSFVFSYKPDSSFVLCLFSQQQLLHDSDSISGVGGEWGRAWLLVVANFSTLPSNGTNFAFNQLLHLALHCRFAGSKNTAWMMIAVFSTLCSRVRQRGVRHWMLLPTITRELIGILTSFYQVGLSELLPFSRTLYMHVALISSLGKKQWSSWVSIEILARAQVTATTCKWLWDLTKNKLTLGFAISPRWAF
jgi:hypothetical protein